MSAWTTSERTESSVLPFNRKYLGSKRQLREWLADRICSVAGLPRVFLDGFFGTGAVSIAMARRGTARIVAVDTLRSNCVILRGFAGWTPAMAGLLDRLNAVAPKEGYVRENYGGTYFTEENCRRMDGIREEIAGMKAAGEISDAAHDAALASFLLAADRVANTLGQYDAFMKNIGGQSRVDGRHVLDERVRSPFLLRPLERLPGALIDVREGDMNSLAPGIEADVAYFDPPYNHRQYCDNYHVLENLARWQKPPLFGKTRKFDRSGLHSPYSRKREAAEALRGLVAATRAAHLFLSYSSEGILPPEQILGILSSRGRPSVTEISYPVFGNGAGVSSRRSVVERLFHVAVGG